jgi:ubiquinone/menaquinone biosynthesis C-methylase UbiE
MGHPGERSHLLPEATSHYATGYEETRLEQGRARLELLRTQILLRRYLPSPPARVLDVGGAAGVYSAWLARQSYDVHLIDALPLHVELATNTSASQPDHPFTAEVGDGRALPVPDESVDAVLVMGPLYHLTERADRVQSLREARRVLRPGGVVLAVTISRFASLFDGLYYRFLDDPAFRDIVEEDLRSGQHRNPENHPAYFTISFFHHPDDLRDEVRDAGLALEGILAVEGPAWLFAGQPEWWDDEERRARLLHAVEAVEREPSLLGMTAHLMAVARRL